MEPDSERPLTIRLKNHGRIFEARNDMIKGMFQEYCTHLEAVCRLVFSPSHFMGPLLKWAGGQGVEFCGVRTVTGPFT